MRTLLLACLFATTIHAQTMPVLAPAPGTGTLPGDGGTSFTFVVAGDNRPAKATCPQPPQLTDVVNGIAALKPAFALWDGDIVYGKDTSTVAQQYPGFLSIITKAGVPIFIAPGNHEMNVIGTCNGSKADIPDTSGVMSKDYQAAIGQLYGAFRYGNSAFIAVNTDDAPGSYQWTACTYNGYVGKGQNDALKAALDAYQADSSIAHVFVFMHRPLKAFKKKDALGPTTEKHIAKTYSILESTTYTKLEFVFASHEHLFYANGSDQKGPFTNGSKRRYLVTGGAGAPLKGSGGSASYFNYLTVNVNGAAVTATIVPVNDTSSNCN